MVVRRAGAGSLVPAGGGPLPFAGTRGFSAPELRDGRLPDERSDLYSVGALGLAMCGTASPGAVLFRATADDPAARFASSTEMLEALRQTDAPIQASEAAQPYRYLEPFAEADGPWFFGREGETRQLATLLEGRPITGLLGASGAGKSSLVLAGLVPRLRRSDRWTLSSCCS